MRKFSVNGRNFVSRETFLASLKKGSVLFNDYFCYLRKRLNRYFKFTVNGKYVGFTGLLLAIQDSEHCSLELAFMFVLDLYLDVMGIVMVNGYIVKRCFGLKIKFYAK